MRHFRPLAVLVAASALTLTGCVATGSLTESATAPDTITLGAVLPLTGSSATIGADQQRGIELAIAEINADGGVDGKQLAVDIEDSQGSAAGGLDAARKLVSVQKVPAVIGEFSSGVTIPIGSYLQEQGVVQLNIGSSSPAIADIGDYSFSTIGLDTLAGSFTAQDLIDHGFESVGIIVYNNAAGEGIVATLSDAFTELGGTVTESVLYTEGQTDYRAELQRVADSDPDVIVYSAYGQDAALINQQAFELGLNKTPWYGVYLTMCVGDSDPSIVEGQIGMDVNYTGPDGDAYVAAYKEAYGEDLVSSYSAYGYDAVQMIAEAIESAGSSDPADIRDALASRTEPYAGVTGPIGFDEDNQRAEQPYATLSFTDGALTVTNGD